MTYTCAQIAHYSWYQKKHFSIYGPFSYFTVYLLNTWTLLRWSEGRSKMAAVAGAQPAVKPWSKWMKSADLSLLSRIAANIVTLLKQGSKPPHHNQTVTITFCRTVLRYFAINIETSLVEGWKHNNVSLRLNGRARPRDVSLFLLWRQNCSWAEIKDVFFWSDFRLSVLRLLKWVISEYSLKGH